MPSNLGSFNFRLNGNYLHKLQFIPTVGAEVDDDRGEGPNERKFIIAPEYSATGDLTWTINRLTFNYGVNYFSKTLRTSNERLEAEPDIFAKKYLYYKARWEHEAQAAFDITDRHSLYGGVKNLLDTKPDVGITNYPVSQIGRFFYAGVRLKLR